MSDEVEKVLVTTGDGRILERHYPADKPRLSKADQLAQATAMYHRRLFGDGTIAKLAEDFNLHPTTVNKRLRLARTDGVPAEAREAFISDMLPAAMAVVREAMGQVEDRKLALAAAKMVIEGLEAMKVSAAAADSNQQEESLEIYRERIQIIRTGRQADSAGDRADLGTIIDASPIPAADSTSHAAAGPVPSEEFPLRRAGWGTRPLPTASEEDPGPECSPDGLAARGPAD